MKNALLLFALSFVLHSLSAQTRKHDWLVGGTALVHFKTIRTLQTFNAVTDVKIRYTNLNISPDAGYFLTDRFVAGVRLLYANHNINVLSGTELNFGGSKDYGAGPFVRYYFLPSTKRLNIILDGSYQFATQRSTAYIHIDNRPAGTLVTNHGGYNASIMGGPVFNVNSKLGVELLAAYTNFKYSDLTGKANRLMAGLGVHVYL